MKKIIENIINIANIARVVGGEAKENNTLDTHWSKVLNFFLETRKTISQKVPVRPCKSK